MKTIINTCSDEEFHTLINKLDRMYEQQFEMYQETHNHKHVKNMDQIDATRCTLAFLRESE